jgi:hypothetical protein
VGKATLAMLVPSEDSSMDNDRLASAHRIDGVLATLPAVPETASFRPAMIDFNMNSLSGDSRHGADMQA